VSDQSLVYLAARYSRREELLSYRAQLEAMGFTVTSRWLNGAHQVDNNGLQLGDDGERLVEACADPIAGDFATEDMADVAAAYTVVAFTEPPRSSASRGGRHVELGMALAWAKRVIVVGPRENVFCWLPYVEHFDEWHGAFDALCAVSFQEKT